MDWAYKTPLKLPLDVSGISLLFVRGEQQRKLQSSDIFSRGHKWGRLQSSDIFPRGHKWGRLQSSDIFPRGHKWGRLQSSDIFSKGHKWGRLQSSDIFSRGHNWGQLQSSAMFCHEDMPYIKSCPTGSKKRRPHHATHVQAQNGSMPFSGRSVTPHNIAQQRGWGSTNTPHASPKGASCHDHTGSYKADLGSNW